MSASNDVKLTITNNWAKKAKNPTKQDVIVRGDCLITNYNPKEMDGTQKGYVTVTTQDGEKSIQYGNDKGKSSKRVVDLSEQKYSLFLAVANLRDEDGDEGNDVILSLDDIYAIKELNRDDYGDVHFYDVLKDLKNGVIRFVNYAQETLLRIDFKTNKETNQENAQKTSVTSKTTSKKSKVAPNKTVQKTKAKEVKENIEKSNNRTTNSLSFLRALANQESGGETRPYFCMNSAGYVGRYQMGEQAMADMGVYKKASKGKMGAKYDNSWRGVFVKNKYGIKSLWDYRKSPEKQEKLQIDYKKKVWQYIQNLKLNEYINKRINGVRITESGLLAGAHLVGVGGLEKYLKSNGKNDVKDGNGTRVSYYIKKFANYDVSEFTQN